MTVRFATTCDVGPCRVRSAEYSSWPACRECGADCCPDHEAAGTRQDADLDQPATCLCVDCVLDFRF